MIRREVGTAAAGGGVSGNTQVEEEVPEDRAALLITGDVTPADDRPGTDGDAVPVRGIHRRARPPNNKH